MIDGFVFFTLLVIAFVLLIAKIQYREFFQFISATIFFLLGWGVISGEPISFLTIIDDGVNPINQTNYVIPEGSYGFSNISLGFFLVMLGIIGVFVGMLSWFSYKGRKE